MSLFYLITAGICLVLGGFVAGSMRMDVVGIQREQYAAKVRQGQQQLIGELVTVAGELTESAALCRQFLRDLTNGRNPEEWHDRAELILESSPDLALVLLVTARVKAILAGIS